MTASESLKQFLATTKTTASKAVVAVVSTATSVEVGICLGLDKIIDFNKSFIDKHTSQKGE